MRNQIYCSWPCYLEGHRGDTHHSWRGGHDHDGYPIKFDDALKDRIKERDGGVCVLCGASGEQLVVHHIDYDKDNLDEGNLVSLCCRCHGLTNGGEVRREEWTRLFRLLWVPGGRVAWWRHGEVERSRIPPV